ncbi:MAG TPA: hypothetical protein VLH86_06405 [Patescibacteria group bacterium]|nr:hypothetical protein [Patescibacteria group bacterium]
MTAGVAPLGDRIVAKGIETASVAFCMVPFLGRFVVGQHPVEWHATTTYAGHVKSWSYSAGDPDAGRLRAHFRIATILGAECGPLYDQAEKYGGRPAAARKIGEAVLVTELPPEGELPVNPDGNGSGLVLVSVGQGRRPSALTVGVYLPNTNHFVDAATEAVCVDRKVPLEVLHLFYPEAVQL